MSSCSASKPSIRGTLIACTLYMICMLSAKAALAKTANPPQASPPSDLHGFNNFIIVVILVAITTLFFLVIFSTICIINRSFGSRPFRSSTSITHTSPIRQIPVTTKASHGLDRDVLNTFPVIKYTEIMKLKLPKDSLECQVCLSEFSEHDSLRLIPGCCHVFHPSCIDAWLTNSVNCPVCRSDLTNASLVAVSKKLRPDGSTGNILQPDLTDASLNRFMLLLPMHLTENIHVSSGNHLSASIDGSSYDVTVQSGRWLSFTRTHSKRNQNECIGELSRNFCTGSQTISISTLEVLDRV